MHTFIRGTIALTVGAALALGTSLAASAETTWDTSTGWNGTSFISSWGSPNTSTYGQTFVAPDHVSVLSSFEFRLEQQYGTPVTANAEIAEWDAATSRPATDALWSSDDVVFAASTTEFTPFSFAPKLTVKPGTMYVIYFTLSGHGRTTAQPNGTYRWAAQTTNTAIPTGQFVFFNNGTNYDQLRTGTWSTIAQDLVGSIVFADPATVTAVFPPTGSSLGGESLTIGGTGFTGATAVSIGGTPVTSFTIDSDTQITAVAGAHGAGVADVTVTDPDGSSTLAGVYTYVAPPVTVVAPVRAAAAHFTVSTSDAIESAGAKTRVTASGLSAGETYTIRVGGTQVATGTATRAGTVSRAITLPAALASGVRKVAVAGSQSDRIGTTSIRIVRATTLRLTVSPKVGLQANRDVTITVRGLAPHEPVTLVYNGKRVSPSSAVAGASGAYRITISAGWGWGARSASAHGVSNDRSGSTRIIVNPRTAD